MINIPLTLSNLDSFLRNNKIDYIIIGGTAAVLYGRLRTTEDIDVTLKIDLEKMLELHSLLTSYYSPRMNESSEFFIRNFVLPVFDKETNIRIDFSAGLTEFDRNAIKRRVRKNIGDKFFYVCSLEDLILYKLFSGRPIDLIDVEELIKHPIQKIDVGHL